MLHLVLIFIQISQVLGHGAVVYPPPRQSVDRNLAPWNGPVPEDPPSVESMTGWCPVPARDGTISGQNGQACFWFSNGCSIGCDICDGTSRGPIPNSKDPFWRRKFNTCNSTTAKATICDPKFRTVNRDAECGAPDDWYYYSPWRKPGSAPVFDSCGMAGGHKPPNGGFGGIYVNTTNAKLGDIGTKVLPKYDTGVVWKAGETVEVSWTIEANHAGGYLYRLCALNRTLNEDCFNEIPLEFTGKQSLRWGGVNGTQIFFEGLYVSEGTMPKGSKWAINPISRNDEHQTGKGFEPKCKEPIPIEKCQGMTDGKSAVPDLEIVDYVKIPSNLPEGQYVLNWRWDCEESNQIWQSCSDVIIKSA